MLSNLIDKLSKVISHKTMSSSRDPSPDHASGADEREPIDEDALVTSDDQREFYKKVAEEYDPAKTDRALVGSNVIHPIRVEEEVVITTTEEKIHDTKTTRVYDIMDVKQYLLASFPHVPEEDLVDDQNELMRIITKINNSSSNNEVSAKLAQDIVQKYVILMNKRLPSPAATSSEPPSDVKEASRTKSKATTNQAFLAKNTPFSLITPIPQTFQEPQGSSSSSSTVPPLLSHDFPEVNTYNTKKKPNSMNLEGCESSDEESSMRMPKSRSASPEVMSAGENIVISKQTFFKLLMNLEERITRTVREDSLKIIEGYNVVLGEQSQYLHDITSQVETLANNYSRMEIKLESIATSLRDLSSNLHSLKLDQMKRHDDKEDKVTLDSDDEDDSPNLPDNDIDEAHQSLSEKKKKMVKNILDSISLESTNMNKVLHAVAIGLCESGRIKESLKLLDKYEPGKPSMMAEPLLLSIKDLPMDQKSDRITAYYKTMALRYRSLKIPKKVTAETTPQHPISIQLPSTSQSGGSSFNRKSRCPITSLEDCTCSACSAPKNSKPPSLKRTQANQSQPDDLTEFMRRLGLQ
uniref:Phosphoprotein n=1 Tax=Crocidura lasiura lispivirus 2 TaxID=3139472 RepID=A0AB38ZJQ0_9MONO